MFILSRAKSAQVLRSLTSVAAVEAAVGVGVVYWPLFPGGRGRQLRGWMEGWPQKVAIEEKGKDG